MMFVMITQESLDWILTLSFTDLSLLLLFHCEQG